MTGEFGWCNPFGRCPYLLEDLIDLVTEALELALLRPVESVAGQCEPDPERHQPLLCGSSACARGVPANQLTTADKQPQVDWPASSPWVLAVGGTNLTLAADNTIASSGAWNDTAFPAPFTTTAGGGTSAFEARPWWQPAQSFATSGKRMVPDIAAFADASPGYPIVCSSGVQGCKGSGQSIAFVGGTSAAAPLVAGMIALWNQQAPQPGPTATRLHRIIPSSVTPTRNHADGPCPRAPTRRVRLRCAVRQRRR